VTRFPVESLEVVFLTISVPEVAGMEIVDLIDPFLVTVDLECGVLTVAGTEVTSGT
jgi:hypothetical protein